MQRRAVTLPELLLVVVLLGLLAATGAPRLITTRDRAALRTARADLLRSLDAARGAAIRLGRPVDLTTADGALQLDPAGSDPPIWRLPAPEASGVTLNGLSSPIRFGPSGIAMGVSNRTLRLLRGGDTLEVILSRLGRIR